MRLVSERATVEEEKAHILVVEDEAPIRRLIRAARSQGWQQGVDQYCMKPFEPRQFVDVVEAVLASTDNELARHRQSEIERTQLLHLVDNAFDES
jgi:FixJ family two-component response regulator